MSLKPIEAGCLAVVVKSWSGNEGRSGRVLKYIGEVDGYCHKNRWKIDFPLTDTIGKTSFHIDEHQLMRIDGYKEESKAEQKELVF